MSSYNFAQTNLGKTGHDQVHEAMWISGRTGAKNQSSSLTFSQLAVYIEKQDENLYKYYLLIIFTVLNHP